MNKREKPIVGQKLFSLNVGNAARYGNKQLTPVIVTNIGRKFFTVEGQPNTLFKKCFYYLDTWQQKTEYSATSCLYLTEQEWLDEKESRVICSLISESFQHGNNQNKLSLESLRKIKELITLGNK